MQPPNRPRKVNTTKSKTLKWDATTAKRREIRAAFMATHIIIVAKRHTADSWVLLNRRSLREAAVLLWALNAMFHV